MLYIAADGDSDGDSDGAASILVSSFFLTTTLLFVGFLLPPN